MKWSQFYAAGQQMGFAPRQIDEMTLWEFSACREGWRATNGIKTKRNVTISDERLAEMGIAGF